MCMSAWNGNARLLSTEKTGRGRGGHCGLPIG